MKNMKCLILVVFVLLLSPAPARAYLGLCCSKCGGNMPMNIPGGGVPETHEFRFKLGFMFMEMEGLRDGTDNVDGEGLLGMPDMGKFMAVQTGMDMFMTNLAAGFSFTDDFFGGLMFMWQQKRMPMKFNSMMKEGTGKDGFTMESEGMADTMLMTKYRLYADDPLIPMSQVSFFLGLSLPTGSISEKNSNHPVPMRKDELLPYGMQLGSGTFDPIIGLLYQGSSSPLWWGANFMYTGRWYENGQDWRLGDELRLDLYAMYQLRYDLLAQLQLNAKSWGRIGGLLDESKTGESGRAVKGDPTSNFTTPLYDPDNYGGEKVGATVGLQFQPIPLHVLDLSVGVPLYQDLNGPQLEEDYTVMLTWYIELPTKASIRYTGPEGRGKSRLGF